MAQLVTLQIAYLKILMEEGANMQKSCFLTGELSVKILNLHLC